MSLLPIFGSDQRVALADGRHIRPINLNGAATTPPLVSTMETVERFLRRYSTYSRGAGPLAEETADAVEQAKQQIRSFFGVRADHELVFRENTSGAINLFVRLLHLTADDVVIGTAGEHTSNNLPWRQTPATVLTAGVSLDGTIDHDELERLARAHAGRVRVITVTGANNLTGFIPDLARIGRLADEVGALFFVDAAQLAPHRPIDLAVLGIDALACSAHKVYAPFGLGLLVVPQTLLDQAPADPGGGSIDMLDEAGKPTWAPVDERHQIGTWNTVGIVAFGASCAALQAAGWPRIVEHEQQLRDQLLAGLEQFEGVTLHVPAEQFRTQDRIGTIPFSVHGLVHDEVAAKLAAEGFAVRSGTICNHRWVRRVLGISDKEQAATVARLEQGDRHTYGVVRASLGLHNSAEEVERFLTTLQGLARQS